MRVEYGAFNVESEAGETGETPFIAIEMIGGKVVTFTSDIVFDDSKSCEEFCVLVQNILAECHDKNPSKKHHSGGRESELV